MSQFSLFVKHHINLLLKMADFVGSEDDTELTAEELAKKLKKQKEVEAGVIELGDEDSADDEEVLKNDTSILPVTYIQLLYTVLVD